MRSRLRLVISFVYCYIVSKGGVGVYSSVFKYEVIYKL